MKKFVADSIAKTYKESTVEDIKAELARTEPSSKAAVVHVTRNSVPISYSYLSYKFHDTADFYTSKTGDHRRLYNIMDQPYTDYIVRLPSNLSVNGKKVVSFKFGSETRMPREYEHMAIFPFIKFLSIPELKRSSFNEYCSDYTTSEDTESIKPSVCIVVLKSSNNELYDEFIKMFKEEQQNLLPKFYKQTSEKNSDIFDAIKSIQFAYIDQSANRIFDQFVKTSVEVKNPRAFVYVSALNKIKFYNSVDSLADDLEDIERGSYSTVNCLDCSSISFRNWLNLICLSTRCLCLKGHQS